MAAPDQDVNLLQWALGALSAGALAVAGWLWNRLTATEARLNDRLDRQEAVARAATEASRAAATAEIRALWEAFDLHRRDTAEYRERILERMGEVATKSDLREMKQDIKTMLERQS